MEELLDALKGLMSCQCGPEVEPGTCCEHIKLAESILDKILRSSKMPEIKRYTVIVELSSGSLVRVVNSFLKLGWIPCGGICTDRNEAGQPFMYQAMISYSITDHS